MIQPIRDTLMNIYDTETHLILQLCLTDNNLFLLGNVKRGEDFKKFLNLEGACLFLKINKVNFLNFSY